MKSREEIMEILEAFDLTGSFRDAAELAGCSHHTVAAWVAKREAGQLPVAGEIQRRERKIDPFLPKVEEWVERSLGKIRADVAFRRLRRLGFAARTAPCAGRSAKPSSTTATAATGSIGPGSPNRACGPSGTGARGRASGDAAPTCSAPGWPGAATGW